MKQAGTTQVNKLLFPKLRGKQPMITEFFPLQRQTVQECINCGLNIKHYEKNNFTLKRKMLKKKTRHRAISAGGN